jgi:hypothetical protein
MARLVARAISGTWPPRSLLAARRSNAVCHRHWGVRFVRENKSNLDLDDAVLYAHLPGCDAPNQGFWDGYCDAQAGRPPDYDFNIDDVVIQHTYEAGHDLGVRLLARGFRIAWPNRTKLPKALIKAAEETAQ